MAKLLAPLPFKILIPLLLPLFIGVGLLLHDLPAQISALEADSKTLSHTLGR